MKNQSLRDWLLTLRNVVIALAVIAVGSALPPLQALESWIAPRRTELTWWVGGLAFTGWVLFMGAVIYRILKGGASLTREEIEATVKSVRDGLEIPYASRVSKYWVPKKAVGAGFRDEMTIRQFKEGWRLQLWRRDYRWRGIFLMAFGALFMMFGIFGIFIVVGPPGIKFLCGLVLLYAVARTVLALRRA